MRVACLIAFNSLVLSCSTPVESKKRDPTHQNYDTTIKSIDAIKSQPFVKNISQLVSDSCSIMWYGGDGIYLLCFEKNKVHFLFTPSCNYWFKTKLNNEKLIFFWDYNADCDLDRLLNKDYGIKKHPIVGQPFGEFVLINDTTLRVNYYYSDWVDKINKEKKILDTLFPTQFIRKRK